MIYLDNSATTKPCKEAVLAYENVLENFFGNPSSVHRAGAAAAKCLEEARRTLAASLHAEPQEVFFTSGGTMADNLAVFGSVSLKRGGTIVTTAIEHPAVKNACDALLKQGFQVIFVKPDKSGVVSDISVRDALTADTVLVSIMHVNNETGAVMPIEKIKRHMQSICPKALLHTDCVQSFGKLPVLPHAFGADLVSASAHKLHGVRGAGLLYVKRGIKLRPILFGGGQERGVAPGTENLPAIAAFAAAVSCNPDIEKIKKLGAILRKEVAKIPEAYINSPENGLPHILNVSFGDIPSEVMTNALSEAGICVSSGSACAAARSEKSYVLRAMDAPKPDGGVRFSLSKMNTEEEIQETIQALHAIVPMLSMAIGGNRRGKR